MDRKHSPRRFSSPNSRPIDIFLLENLNRVPKERLVQLLAFYRGAQAVNNQIYQSGFNGNIFPVSKEVQVGPKGGLYYINKSGNKIYLNNRQKRELENGKLVLCRGRLCRV